MPRGTTGSEGEEGMPRGTTGSEGEEGMSRVHNGGKEEEIAGDRSRHRRYYHPTSQEREHSRGRSRTMPTR